MLCKNLFQTLSHFLTACVWTYVLSDYRYFTLVTTKLIIQFSCVELEGKIGHNVLEIIATLQPVSLELELKSFENFFYQKLDDLFKLILCTVFPWIERALE